MIIISLFFPGSFVKIITSAYSPTFTGEDIAASIPVLIYTMISLIVGLGALVHIVLVEITGLSMYQNISKGKAFLGLLISFAIVFGIIVVLVLFITLLIFLISSIAGA